MRLIAQKTVDFPSIGRVVKEGEFTASEEDAKIFLTSPYIKLIIKQEKNGTQSKTRSRRNRR